MSTTLHPFKQPPVQQLKLIKEATGMSSKQIARLLDVGSHTIYSWSMGSKMFHVHQRKIVRVLETIFFLHAGTPEGRYNILFDTSQGKSLFYTLQEELIREAKTPSEPTNI